MVRTMRKVPKETKPVGSEHKDSARLAILRQRTPVSKPESASQDEGRESEAEMDSHELPALNEVLKRRRDDKGDVKRSGEAGDDADGSEPASDNDEEENEDEDEDEADTVESGAHDAKDMDDDVHEMGEIDDPAECEELGGTEIETAASEENEDEGEEYEADDGSSDVESTSAGKAIPDTTIRWPKHGKQTRARWDEPEDTHTLLDLLEQFAMRDHYVNIRTGGWKNNAFGEVAERMGKESKLCNNKYLALKYRYLEILSLLDLGIGLSWDDKRNEVVGSKKAWRQVRDPKLAKLKGRTFMFKEEMDSLNSTLKFAPSPQTKTAEMKAVAAGRPSTVRGPNIAGHSMALQSPETADEGVPDSQLAEESRDEHQERDHLDEAGPTRLSPKTTSDATNRRRSPKHWFDMASIHELVRLLVEYVQDDYYISPITKQWKNGVFREISAKIGKHQGLCQSKWSHLRDTYVEIEKLLALNSGFKWDAEKSEVVGSNEAWAKVKESNLIRLRRLKFFFRDEFAKLVEKLNFERREYAPRRLKRDRTSARTSFSRRSYVEPPDDVDESLAGENNAGSGDEIDGDEPPRKRRLLSDTYEKRREAFYIAARTMSTKREELKAIVDAQLAVHKEQMAALQAHHVVEHKLALRLEECHLKDTLRRDTLEGLRSTAHARLQHEICLTLSGKLTIMRTLPYLRSKADGYLGVMFLDPVIRKLWLKAELERLCQGQVGEFFIEEAESTVYQVRDSLAKDHEEEEDLSALTLVKPDCQADGDAAISAKSGCENDDSGIGIHYRGDGCSSNPAVEKDAPNNANPQEPCSTRSYEQKSESDEFEIDPYISIEARKDGESSANAQVVAEEGQSVSTDISPEEVADGVGALLGSDVEDDFADGEFLGEWLAGEPFGNLLPINQVQRLWQGFQEHGGGA